VYRALRETSIGSVGLLARSVLTNLVSYFQDLEETPNESAHYYYITRVLGILGDESHRPVWPVLYPSSRFEDNLLKLLHGIRTEIKEIPRTTPPAKPAPPAPTVDITPMVDAMEEKLEDLKRETASSLKSFAEAVKASAPPRPPPSLPIKPKNSTPSIKGNPLPKAVIRFCCRITPDTRPSFIDLTNRFNNSLHNHPKFSHVRVIGVKWTVASNLLVCAQAPSPSTLVAALEAVQEVISRDFAVKDIIPNTRWSRVTLSHVYTGMEETDSCAYSPEEIHEELTTHNPSYVALTIRQLPSWVRNPESFRAEQVSSISFTFEDSDGTQARQLLGSTLTAFGNLRCNIKAWIPPKKTPQKSRLAPLSPPVISAGILLDDTVIS